MSGDERSEGATSRFPTEPPANSAELAARFANVQAEGPTLRVTAAEMSRQYAAAGQAGRAIEEAALGEEALRRAALLQANDPIRPLRRQPGGSEDIDESSRVARDLKLAEDAKNSPEIPLTSRAKEAAARARQEPQQKGAKEAAALDGVARLQAEDLSVPMHPQAADKQNLLSRFSARLGKFFGRERSPAEAPRLPERPQLSPEQLLQAMSARSHGRPLAPDVASRLPERPTKPLAELMEEIRARTVEHHASQRPSIFQPPQEGRVSRLISAVSPEHEGTSRLQKRPKLENATNGLGSRLSAGLRNLSSSGTQQREPRDPTPSPRREASPQLSVVPKGKNIGL